VTTQFLPELSEIDGPEDFERAYLVPEKPHLRVNFISSLDGAIEISGRSGPLGGRADRAAFMAMRAVADVIMVGAGTARAEDYGPVRLDESVQQRRGERGQIPCPPLVVVTARGNLEPGARMFATGAEVIVLTTSQVVAERTDLARVAELVACGDAYVDLAAGLEKLRSRGLERVLCEGGPELMRSLMMVGLVDELCLTLAPVLAGPQHRRLAGPGPLPQIEPFQLSALIVAEGMLLTRYER
jgi:riboflavin biosynthesis pyrimidine reductase